MKTISVPVGHDQVSASAKGDNTVKLTCTSTGLEVFVTPALAAVMTSPSYRWCEVPA